MEQESFRTIVAPAQTHIREKGSRFMAFAYPVSNAEEAGIYLSELRKKYHDATHHCYAWKFGYGEGETRANDDGEPSGTAGRPILGQILSKDLTNILVVVVRYFGGTKLGVPGLISAYKESANEVLEFAEIIEKEITDEFEIKFSFNSMNKVMKAVKECGFKIGSQSFDNLCFLTGTIGIGQSDRLISSLSDDGDIRIEKIEN